jgi:hypothetical protein
MTRIESIMSQMMELTPSERATLRQFLDQNLEVPQAPLSSDVEDESSLTSEQMAEVYRRLEDYDAGTAIIEDQETVFRKLYEHLQKRRA